MLLKPGDSIRGIELPVQTAGGESHLIQVNLEYLLLSGKHLLFSQGIDITDLKRSESYRERFRFMVEKSGNEIYLVNPDGSFEYVNEAAARSLGYRAEERLKLDISGIDPEYGPRFGEYFEENKAHDMPLFETIHIGKDGRRIVKEIKTVFLRIDDDEFICGFGRDITDKKQMIVALHESEEKYRNLVENMQDGFFYRSGLGDPVC